MNGRVIVLDAVDVLIAKIWELMAGALFQSQTPIRDISAIFILYNLQNYVHRY